MIARLRIFLALTASALAGNAVAQDNIWVSGRDTNGARYVVPDAKTVAADISTGFAGSGIVVEAQPDKTEASVQLSRTESKTTDGKIRAHGWTIKATAPLDESSKLADFITDSGLPGTWSLALAYSSVSAPRLAPTTLSPDTLIEILEKAAEACKESGKTDCGTKASELAPWMDSVTAKELLGLTEPHWTKVWSVSATAGRKELKWRDAVTLAENDDTRAPWGVSGQWGVKRSGGKKWYAGWYGGVGAEYKQDYKDGKKRILCQPATLGTPQECFQGPFSGPKRDISATAFLIARKYAVIEGWDVPIGLQLKPAYDFETKVTGLEATLYVVPDKDGKLSGGLRLKAQTQDDDDDTDDDNFTVGVFAGTSF
ncbi:MAG: hypothetical protein QM608_15245 [Caulobacter sp.]